MNITKDILKLGGNSISVTSLDNRKNFANCRTLSQQTTSYGIIIAHTLQAVVPDKYLKYPVCSRSIV